MPFALQENNGGRNVPVQRLDSSRLSVQHEWDVYPQTDISFRYIVEENPEPRADALRYKVLANVSVQAAQTTFAAMCRCTTLFKVPATIQCDRTFARDAEEAYYLDAMDAYLRLPPGHLRVEDLPILKSPLRSRFFCAFARRQLYFTELYDRRRLGHWISYSPEISHFSDTELTSWFPKEENWVKELTQPAALPVPVPPSLHFYHRELRDAQLNPILADIERTRRLRFCAENEHYIFFIAMWWNDVYFGGKAFVLTPHTIEIFNGNCGHLHDVAGKPAQAIIERMRMFSDMPTHFHNWMCFSDRSLENSLFIFAVRNSGVHDHTIQSGRSLWCRRNHRSVTTTRYAGNTFRRVSLLEQRVTVPDLEEVPGLLGLVAAQRWTEYNSMRIGDLLHLLMSLEKSSSSQLRDCRQDLRFEKFEHDSTSRRVRELESQVQSSRRELQETHRRFEDTKARADALRVSLQRSRKEADRLQRDNDEKQHRIIATQQQVRELLNGSARVSRCEVLRSTGNLNRNVAMISRSQVSPPSNGIRSIPSTPRQVPAGEDADCGSPCYSPPPSNGQETDGNIVDEGSNEHGPTTMRCETGSASGATQRNRQPLRKVKPGYLFHPMPRKQGNSAPTAQLDTNTTSAQTTENPSSNNVEASSEPSS